MNDTIVEIKDVSFAYNGQSVLSDVNLTIRDKAFVAIIGPNGGGKTTLLKLMLGLLRPDAGEIRVLGKIAGTDSTPIGYVPQDVHINTHFPITALDVVTMGMLEPGKRWRKLSNRQQMNAMDALEQMEIAHLGERRISDLSGGQRQRVVIARALVSRPRLLLLDEPTASIDTRGQSEFFRLLKNLNRDVTIVVVSHDLLAISTHVKSVACVNNVLHYHNRAEITGEMLETMYPCAEGDVCPVELLAHGLPHRVLKEHE